ncbi:hypothetical protein ASF49_21460 [Methylobacterium sp. Leaf104]|uniref:hypothetical protein n=1 Tax=Methylobacterium TaxID=407 RepID=UPI0006FEADEA|nr:MULTISPECIES: hypothetical protein [Methylobacterium]KQP40072.1 hypothetical protein ASF49_21460 [Methylobacterium sp. Leaf104]MCI9881957.1 hypothetical protein [Methylobacterium goesingense]
MRRSLVLNAVLSVLVLAAGPTFAQAPAAPPRPATTWVPVEEPMSALLNGGHRIVSASGPSFTLERGGKYVVCEVRTAGGMRGTAETTSTCHRLN